METVYLPYGREKMTLSVEDGHLKKIAVSSLPQAGNEAECLALIRKALEHPIGSKRLSELAKGKKKITVITSDHTRPVPSRLMMPLLLSQIRQGSPDAEITILVATGLHRTTTQKELEEKLGAEICAREKIVIHDCDAPDPVFLGTLPSGAVLEVDPLAAGADLVVAEGFIEPHFFAGFSGGRKSILPGVCSRRTVMANHCAAMIDHPLAKAGALVGNPIHEDMAEAARRAGLAFILNVVLDAAHRPVFACAGDPFEAHKAGTDYLLSHVGVPVQESDIAVSTNGGYPLDQNIYQSVKGLSEAVKAVRSGGVIIMLSEAADGHGGAGFYETFRREKDLQALKERFLSRKAEETEVDQWQSQILIRVLQKAEVIFVSSCPDEMVRSFGMIPAHSAQEALEEAVRRTGRLDYTVNVIPDGVSVILSAEEADRM